MTICVRLACKRWHEWKKTYSHLRLNHPQTVTRVNMLSNLTDKPNPSSRQQQCRCLREYKRNGVQWKICTYVVKYAQHVPAKPCPFLSIQVSTCAKQYMLSPLTLTVRRNLLMLTWCMYENDEFFNDQPFTEICR